MTVVYDGDGGLYTLVDPCTVIGAAMAGSHPVSKGPATAVTEDLGGGVLRITLRAGSRITEEDAALVRHELLTRSGGADTAVLLQITGVESVSREAVRFFSEAATVTAFAILGNTPVDRVIAHGLRGLLAPGCPSRYFSDEQQALSWLQVLTKTAPDIDFVKNRLPASDDPEVGFFRGI
ncbi:hypothetical protein OUO20_05735 [Arthrobacter sp. FX8]|uniref:DUF7793 family protein n=1 Tax=Arthrobacter sp. FX8 TaxID=2997335 RepID=UPI00227A8408|nr:hypothetical protein [Arthrobacter sp. FX8]WAJ34433.1 hypothetical protein OUO20_05735 [Arthrobacter sp. FX8]